MDVSSSVSCGRMINLVRWSKLTQRILSWQEAIERIFVGNRYGDVPKGTFIVRGENVVLMGEIDLDKEDNVSPSVASSIPESALPQLLEAHAAENVTKSQSEQPQGRHAAILARLLR